MYIRDDVVGRSGDEWAKLCRRQRPKCYIQFGDERRLKDQVERHRMNENTVDKTTEKRRAELWCGARRHTQRKVNDLKNPLDELKIGSADETEIPSCLCQIGINDK